ncbi:response regulator [Thalassoroseus pseudoceratinae]|uniref:response regulator n=1 Tax=Thalassoroseus pseudoceratinae TaxID=2713176 RepID=UPI0014241B30|nr:response regulator [Thalassoroseus pseudoceratinae]
MSSLLLVEDSLTQATQIRLTLKKAGYDVYVAENGRLALDVLRTHEPDLVLTDLQMPEMDGLELVDAVRRDHPHLPVVLMTSHGSDDIAIQALRHGAASYLPKSRLDHSMIDTLEDILESMRVADTKDRVQRCLVARSLEFRMENDPTLITSVATHVEQELKNAEFGDDTVRMQIIVALRNALDHAMFFGNLALDPSTRLEGELIFREAAENQRAMPPFSDRSVWLTVRINDDEVRLVVQHEGEGTASIFLPESNGDADLEDPLQRSLILIQTFMDEISVDASGKELTLIRRRPQQEVDAEPLTSLMASADSMTSPAVFGNDREGDVLIVTVLQGFAGFADDRRTEDQERALSRINEEDLRHIVVDFSNVDAFGSAVLESLLKLWQAVKTKDGARFACTGLSEPGVQIIETARFDTVWQIHETREAAVAALIAETDA